MRRLIILMVLILATSVFRTPATPHAAPYLGQRLPGTTPRVFAPGVISTGDIHSWLAISPDGRYLFFCGDDGNFYWVDARIIDVLRPAPIHSDPERTTR